MNRYSDNELEEFKLHIEKKLDLATRQMETLAQQIEEIKENSSDDYGIDFVDDSGTYAQLEMLSELAERKRKYIKELKDSLMRVQNKTYGICVVTGELIDKKRLLAVPTTSKSKEAKDMVEKNGQNKTNFKSDAEPRPPKEAQPKVITKIIRKPKEDSKPSQPVEEEDEELLWDDIEPPIDEAEDETQDDWEDTDVLSDDDDDF